MGTIGKAGGEGAEVRGFVVTEVGYCVERESDAS